MSEDDETARRRGTPQKITNKKHPCRTAEKKQTGGDAFLF